MRIAAIAVALLAMTSIAAAQAPGQTMSWDPGYPPAYAPLPQPAPLETVTVSYKSHIITADLVSLGLMVLGPVVDERDASLSGLGLSGYFLAAPIVHLAHGRGGAAVKSLGLRVALPVLGGWAGYRIGPDDTSCVQAVDEYGHGGHGGCDDHGSIIGLVLGGLFGVGTAMYVDAKYLAKYETTRPAMWSAGITPTRGGASLSFSGSF